VIICKHGSGRTLACEMFLGLSFSKCLAYQQMNCYHPGNVSDSHAKEAQLVSIHSARGHPVHEGRAKNAPALDDWI
jgi:hypothetical protein